MRSLTTIPRAVFTAAVGAALTFGVATAARGGEPSLECMQSGGQASCNTHPSCAYQCRMLGYPAGSSHCDVAARCCYCIWL